MAWKPSNAAAEERFVSLYNAKTTDTELARVFGCTYAQARNFARELRDRGIIKARDGKGARTDIVGENRPVKPAPAPRDLAGEFLAFLCKARTLAEIEKKFGDETPALLEREYSEYRLFSNVNARNQRIYILLPVVSHEIKLEPRLITHHCGVAEDGTAQPYILVNLPEGELFEYGHIDLLPIYDVHFGHVGHKKEKFLSYIRYIQETPNVYAFIGGDLMENALDDGRGMTYDNNANPTTQLDWCTHALAPIAHKLLFALPGNHEWRTYHHAGIDPMEVIARDLRVPYFDGPVYCSVVCGDRKWRMYATHGYGNSQTKGGKMNRAGAPKKYLDFVHFLVSGHVHDPVVNSETCVAEDIVNCRLAFPQQWTVIAPSFLKWAGTYAYRAGYAPPGSGGVRLRLYESGDYDASLT